jgi:hypothetical protein
VPYRQLHSLAVGDLLADGGEGKVFAMEGEPGLVFKQYLRPKDPNAHPPALDELIVAGSALMVDGRGVSRWAAWPAEVVVDGPLLVGFVMPRIPESFEQTIAGKVKPPNLSYLASQPKPIWGALRLPSTAERVEILTSLAGSFTALHERGYVYGDMSFLNVVWTVDPSPQSMLLDCDGIRPRSGRSYLPQKDSIDWDDPKAPPGTHPDVDRDRYKLALAVLRVLSCSLSVRPQASGDAPLAEDLDPNVTAAVQPLLRQAAGPLGSRPSAQQWLTALRGRQMRPVKPPTVRVPEPPIDGWEQKLVTSGSTRPTVPVSQPTSKARAQTPPEGGAGPANASALSRIQPFYLLVPGCPLGSQVREALGLAAETLSSCLMASQPAIGLVSYGPSKWSVGATTELMPLLVPVGEQSAARQPLLGDIFVRLRRRIQADVEAFKSGGSGVMRPVAILIQTHDIDPGWEMSRAQLLSADNALRPVLLVVSAPSVSLAPIASRAVAVAGNTLAERLNGVLRDLTRAM